MSLHIIPNEKKNYVKICQAYWNFSYIGLVKLINQLFTKSNRVMSCPNFQKECAKSYYVINEWDDFMVDDIRETAKEKLKDVCTFVDTEFKDYSDYRNYPACYFVECTEYLYFCGMTIRIKGKLGVRDGNYSGCNLDYDINVEYNSWYNDIVSNLSDCDSGDELCEVFVDGLENDWVWENEECSKGLFMMNKGKLIKALQRKVGEIVDALEDICKSLCDDELACVGIFSNGEAIYERV